MRAENVINGKAVTEYIFYYHSAVYGVILDQWGHICQGSRELYCDGRLTSYTKVLFLHSSEAYELMNLVKESYAYNAEGLDHCIYVQYVATAKICQQTMYHFQYADGLISKYTASDVIGNDPYEILEPVLEYDVRIL